MFQKVFANVIQLKDFTMQMSFCWRPQKHHCILPSGPDVTDLPQPGSWSGAAEDAANEHVLLFLILEVAVFVPSTMFYHQCST